MAQQRAASNAIVVYRGPSAYTGAPIVAILTGFKRPSANAKTGPMLQLSIMSATDKPHVAQKSGGDEAVCGSCPFRPKLRDAPDAPDKPCYVKTFQGPNSTWKANHEREANLPLALALMRGRKVRLGAYGDTAALPIGVVRALAEAAGKLTNYTHAADRVGLKALKASGLPEFAMVSVHTLDAARAAWDEGLRTYRAVNVDEGETLSEGEVWCPFHTHGTQCVDCGLCDGTRPNDKRKSLAIPIHR